MSFSPAFDHFARARDHPFVPHATIDRRLIGIVLACCLALVACGPSSSMDAGADTSDTRASWTCPPEWVPAAVGGCGPAVLLCEPDGGAARGACDNYDVHARRTVDDPDGGTGIAIHRTIDGRFAGGWHEEGEPDSYPAADWYPDAGNGSSGDAWSPDAGIPSCPSGWNRRADGTCDPVLRTNCSAGSGAIPGGACTATAADACPASAFPDPGPAAVGATVVHVDASSDPSAADGSLAHPFASIGPAIIAAGTNGFVLVTTGTYRESILIDAPVHLLGRCANSVRVASRDANAALHVEGIATDAEVRGIDFSAAMANGITVGGGARLRLENSIVANVTGAALALDGPATRVDASELLLHDIAAATGATRGLAISATAGAIAEGAHVSVRAATEAALFTSDAGSRLHLVDSAIVSTRLGDPGHQGAAIAHAASTLAFERVVFDDNPRIGIAAGDSTMDVTDTIVSRSTGTTTAGAAVVLVRGELHARALHVVESAGDGIQSVGSRADIADSVLERVGSDGSGAGILSAGGHVTMTRTIVRDAHTFGALIGFASETDTSTSGEIVDCRFEATGAMSLDPRGIAIAARGLHPLTITNTVVREPTAVGVAVLAASEASIDRVVVREVGAGDSQLSLGMMVAEGSTARAHDVHVSDSVAAGIVVQSAGAHLDLDHSFIGRLRASRIGGTAVGVGMLVADGATASVTRVRIDDVPVLGVSVSESTSMPTGAFCSLSDSAVLHVTASSAVASRDGLGAGVGASPDATLEVVRCRIEANGPMGAYAGQNALLTIRDSVVRDTRSSDDGYAAAGLFAFESGTLDARRVVVEGSENTGVIAWSQGYAHLSDVFVAGVASDAFGFGTGISASGDGVIELDRVSVVNTHGAGIMAAPFQDPLVPRTIGARIVGRDLYVGDVAPATIRIEYDDHGEPVPSGVPVAYAMHAGAMCVLDVQRSVASSGDYGFFVSSGEFDLRDAVIASMRAQAGAQSGAMPQLSRVWFVGNRSDDIVTATDLPEGAMLRTPQLSCSNPACL